MHQFRTGVVGVAPSNVSLTLSWYLCVGPADLHLDTTATADAATAASAIKRDPDLGQPGRALLVRFALNSGGWSLAACFSNATTKSQGALRPLTPKSMLPINDEHAKHKT